MTFEWLFEFLKATPAIVPVVLFAITLAEAIVFTSPIVPATALCLGISAIQQAVGGSFAVILIASALGVFLGDLISYAVGHKYRESVGSWWPFRSRPGWLPSSIAFMQRWGAWGLVGSKFLGPVRWVGPAVCGILQMPFVPFALVTAFASILWSAIVLAPPFYGVKAFGG